MKPKDRVEQNSYKDESGNIRCKTCKEPLFYHGFRALCKCEQDEYARGEEFRKAEMKKREIERKKRESQLSARYADVMFSDVESTEENKEIVQKAKNYVTVAAEAVKQNLGIYLYGGNSSGKTYLTSAMCNELIEKGYDCFYTNLAVILRNSSLFEEDDTLRKIIGSDFLFIDDIGKEFLGREANPEGTKYAERILSETINARYNAQLPTVFSSNYSIQELADDLKLDQGILDRISEMAASVWKLSGDDFRTENLNGKAGIVKKYGI